MEIGTFASFPFPTRFLQIYRQGWQMMKKWAKFMDLSIVPIKDPSPACQTFVTRVKEEGIPPQGDPLQLE